MSMSFESGLRYVDDSTKSARRYDSLTQLCEPFRMEYVDNSISVRSKSSITFSKATAASIQRLALLSKTIQVSRAAEQ